MARRSWAAQTTFIYHSEVIVNRNIIGDGVAGPETESTARPASLIPDFPGKWWQTNGILIVKGLGKPFKLVLTILNGRTRRVKGAKMV